MEPNGVSESDLIRRAAIDFEIDHCKTQLRQLIDERRTLDDLIMTACENVDAYSIERGDHRAKMTPGKIKVNWKREYLALASREAAQIVKAHSPRVPTVVIRKI